MVSVRQNSVECVQILLTINDRYEGLIFVAFFRKIFLISNDHNDAGGWDSGDVMVMMMMIHT